MRRRRPSGPRLAASPCRLAAIVGMLCAASPLTRHAELRAQGSGTLPAPADTLAVSGPARCGGEVIHEIVVYSAAPTFERAARVPVIGAVARTTHATTRPDIVRGFLLFEEGGRCTELARAESERVLRAQPFIAEADVAVLPVEGGVRVEVRTVDEASFVLGSRGVRTGTPYLRSLRVGNSNLGGAALDLRGEWRDGRDARDAGAVSLRDYLFLGQPHELDLFARRASHGGEWHAALSQPFMTNLQRQAWRAGGGELVAYSSFVHPDSARQAVRVERRYADAGAMARIGPPVRMALFGVMLSHEQESVDDTLHFLSGRGVMTRGGAFAPARHYESSRLNGFVGVRSLAFRRLDGLDALTATQDIPTGYQAGLLVGRGLDAPVAGGAHELLLATDLYAGRSDEDDATRLQLRAQSTRLAGEGRWSRTIATGRLAQQYKPSALRTILVSGEWAGTWRPGVPLQLMLGEGDGGVRGYEDARTGGSRRAVVRVEDRLAIPAVRGLGDLGLAAFADAGRVWAGDAPFGVTTPILTSVGVSLLAAVPTRSARVWRLDVAMPLHRPGLRRLEVGLTRGDRSGVFWREPDAIATLRGRAIPASVFAWP